MRSGIAAFGTPPIEGYVFQNIRAVGDERETALDLADPSTAPAFALITNKTCADIINGGKKKVSLSVRAR